MKKLLIITLLFSLPLIAEEKKDIPSELTTQSLKAYLGNLAELPGVDAILQPYVDACLANPYYRENAAAFYFLRDMLLNYKAGLAKHYIDYPRVFINYMNRISDFIRTSPTLSLTIREFREAQRKILLQESLQSSSGVEDASFAIERPTLTAEEEAHLQKIYQQCLGALDLAAARARRYEGVDRVIHDDAVLKEMFAQNVSPGDAFVFDYIFCRSVPESYVFYILSQSLPAIELAFVETLGEEKFSEMKQKHELHLKSLMEIAADLETPDHEEYSERFERAQRKVEELSLGRSTLFEACRFEISRWFAQENAPVPAQFRTETGWNNLPPLKPIFQLRPVGLTPEGHLVVTDVLGGDTVMILGYTAKTRYLWRNSIYKARPDNIVILSRDGNGEVIENTHAWGLDERGQWSVVLSEKTNKNIEWQMSKRLLAGLGELPIRLEKIPIAVAFGGEFGEELVWVRGPDGFLIPIPHVKETLNPVTEGGKSMKDRIARAGRKALERLGIAREQRAEARRAEEGDPKKETPAQRRLREIRAKRAGRSKK